MTLQNYIQYGAAEGERNNAFFTAILQAREQGYNEEFIADTLADRARADGLTDREINNTMRSALTRPITPKAKSVSDDPFMVRVNVSQSPKDQIRDYMSALFESTEIMAYNGKAGAELQPITNGVYSRRCNSILEELKTSDPLTVFSGTPKAGVWCRINPMDGNGSRDSNVAEFRHTLIESDKISISKQLEIIRASKIPCAAIVHSGGKSIHAIVKVDAGHDRELYNKRVLFLHEKLNEMGFEIDPQNKNPSRLSRLPGVPRGSSFQKLISTNTGLGSWLEWESYQKTGQNDLPSFEGFSDLLADPPEMAPEIITGLLRRGHKLLLGGPSKAGKSFALIQLACAIASGGNWFGYNCTKGRVLYVNLEIDRASFVRRVMDVSETIPFDADNLTVWNLRGKVRPLSLLTKAMLENIKECDQFDLIIIDPVYKINEGDENSARDMTLFCNTLENIAHESGASIAFAHHFSKGQQGMKASIDRASGSGVFGRDPDAIGTLTETDTDNEYALEWTLREFASPKPKTWRFAWPRHYEVQFKVPQVKGGGRPTEITMDRIVNAAGMYQVDGKVSIENLSKFLGCTSKTIRSNLKKREITPQSGMVSIDDLKPYIS